MNESLYEQYMRNVLGYNQMNYQNTYDMNFDNFGIPNMSVMNNMQNEELEKCYPDIYRIVYPMVQKACEKNTSRMTSELIDNMTEEIYFAIEDNEIIENRGKDEKGVDIKSEDRQRVVRNRTLNDLIRILILRELLGRPGFPGRPPRPRPPRPPMRPGPRPFNRNLYDTFDFDNSIYEY